MQQAALNNARSGRGKRQETGASGQYALQNCLALSSPAAFSFGPARAQGRSARLAAAKRAMQESHALPLHVLHNAPPHHRPGRLPARAALQGRVHLDYVQRAVDVLAGRGVACTAREAGRRGVVGGRALRTGWRGC